MAFTNTAVLQADDMSLDIRTLGWVIDRSFTPIAYQVVGNTFTIDAVQVTRVRTSLRTFLLQKRLRVHTHKITSPWFPM